MMYQSSCSISIVCITQPTQPSPVFFGVSYKRANETLSQPVQRLDPSSTSSAMAINESSSLLCCPADCTVPTPPTPHEISTAAEAGVEEAEE